MKKEVTYKEFWYAMLKKQRLSKKKTTFKRVHKIKKCELIISQYNLQETKKFINERTRKNII